MALALDASTPASGTQTTGTVGTPIVSSTFSPPSNSVLIVCWIRNSSTSEGSAATPSITDSLGAHLTWNLIQYTQYSDTSAGNGPAAAWWASCPSAQTNMTVTITPTGNFGQACMQVLVITGAAAANPIGANGKAGSASSAATATYTSTVAGSWGWLVWNDYFPSSPGAETLLSGVSEQSRTFYSTTMQMFVQKMTALTSASSTSVTIGASAPADSGRWVYFEIVPAVATKSSITVVSQAIIRASYI